jgi:hypothetical protein
MPELRFPDRLPRESRNGVSRRSAAHRAWVRQHRCSIHRCSALPIECAHVRCGTDGGMGLKPSDCWCISLCKAHHVEQHAMGEPAFEAKYGLDLRALALEFARRSPHRHLLGWAPGSSS